MDGRKEFTALADGYRKSTEAWADLLRECRRRGLRTPRPDVTTDGRSTETRRVPPERGNSQSQTCA
ncbi:hypothetical protein GCM10010402_79080 [Actinomadura luteofluorescens]